MEKIGINFNDYNTREFLSYKGNTFEATVEYISRDTKKETFNQVLNNGIIYCTDKWGDPGFPSGKDPKVRAIDGITQELISKGINKIIFVDDTKSHITSMQEKFKTIPINTLIVNYIKGPKVATGI